jgi:hypothetical protein
MLRRLIAFIALFALGSAVNAQGDNRSFPSLAKRPAETRDRTVPPAPIVQAAPIDAALAAEVERYSREASAADSAFQRILGQNRANVLAASGASSNSESWVVAQVAISAIDSARYESVAALAALDTLHVERQDATDASRVKADLATIDPARLRVLALVDAQNDALDSLRRRLAQP